MQDLERQRYEAMMIRAQVPGPLHPALAAWLREEGPLPEPVQGKSVEVMAAESLNPNIILGVFRAGARNFNASNVHGQSLAHWAAGPATQAHPGVIMALYYAGVDFNIADA